MQRKRIMKAIDLHGVRLHEAEELILKFVDGLYAAGEPCGRIIHGHGVIAGELEKFLRRYPYIARIERDPANSAATVVWLQHGTA